jgi:hypothetical protein
MRCRRFALLAAVAVVTGGSHPRLAAADVSVTKAGDTIEFKAGGQTVAKYHVGPGVAKPYLWPVLAPNGAAVTRAWPMEKGAAGETTDHVHQKSVWFCHGDVIPEGIDLKVKTMEKGGRGVDFWSEAKDKDGKVRHGTIACVKVEEPKQLGKDHAAVTTRNLWKTPEGVVIMEEERTIHFRDLPAGRLFTFECKLTATVCPITFGDTKEGSFGVRVNDAIRTALPTGGTVTAADGKTVSAPAKDNLPVWGQIAAWNDYSGTIDGKQAGIAVFSHPDNPPAAWHTRAYGLMAANPFGREKSGFPSQKGKTDLVRIEKGKALTLRYGVYAHTGDAKAGQVAEAFEQFNK